MVEGMEISFCEDFKAAGLSACLGTELLGLKTFPGEFLNREKSLGT